MGEGDDEQRGLDVAVAVHLAGFRWVCWAPGSAPAAPSEECGRFLAPPRHLLAHLWTPASTDCPVAPQPFRYLPSYSREVDSALQACERCGLFLDGAATLSRTPDGRWRIRVAKAGLDLADASLPCLLCRAGLAWSSPADRVRSPA